jgi:hypothetical protein
MHDVEAANKDLVAQEAASAAQPVEPMAPLTAEEMPTSAANVLVPGTAPPPVPQQRSSHVNTSKLASEKVVVAAPFSFAGSAGRLWKLTGLTDQPGGRIALGVGAILLILLAWTLVLSWYLLWGIFLVPYRLIRRGSRKRKREALQHREQLAAIVSLRQTRD